MDKQKEFTPEQKEMATAYKMLEQERASVVQKILAIEEEKREHELVLSTLNGLEEDRKCWRLVNGILIEKTQKEVVPELELQINNMKAACEQMDLKAASCKEEMQRIEAQFEMPIQNEVDTAALESVHIEKEAGSGGVLV